MKDLLQLAVSPHFMCRVQGAAVFMDEALTLTNRQTTQNLFRVEPVVIHVLR